MGIETLHGIDDKAEHMTRLVGLLLGTVLSVLSLAVRAEGIALALPSPLTGLTLAAGLGCLLVSMGLAIVTYLRSRFEVGPGRRVGWLLSDPDYSITAEEYVRRTLGTYGHVIEKNTAVIDANARLFRQSLVLLLVGVVYLTLAAVLYLGRAVGGGGGPSTAGTAVAWVVVLATTTVVSRFVHSNKYLSLSGGSGDNDRTRP